MVPAPTVWVLLEREEIVELAAPGVPTERPTQRFVADAEYRYPRCVQRGSPQTSGM